MGSRVKFVAKAHSALHPGQSASIELDGKEIGFIGTIHPLIAQKLGLNGKRLFLKFYGMPLQIVVWFKLKRFQNSSKPS